ncbi:MAG: PIN domain-containing protein [bacterium]
MIVVDTSIWIDFFKAKEPVFSHLQGLLENGQVLAVECVFAELMQGAKEKRERDIISGYWQNLPKYSMDGIFFKAGIESGRSNWINQGVGLIDGAILMYARETKSYIWTLDKKLLSLLKKEEKYE